MKKEYWQRVCAKNVDDKRKLAMDNSYFAICLAENAFEHGFFIEPVACQDNEMSSILILEAMKFAGLIENLKNYSFYRELLLEKIKMHQKIKSGIMDNINFGISKQYPISSAYTHFVTMEIKKGVYVDRDYQMIPPEWEEKHEKNKGLYIYISNRMGELEKLQSEKLYYLLNYNINDSCIFEKKVIKLKNELDCTWSFAIIDVLYKMYENELVAK